MKHRNSRKPTERACGTDAIFPGVEYTEDEIELLKRMDRFKREHGVRFPSFTDVMLVMVNEMGYRRESPRPGSSLCSDVPTFLQQRGSDHEVQEMGSGSGVFEKPWRPVFSLD